MSTTIDSLDIQIKTSADQANASLDKLANTIERITNSVKGTKVTNSGGITSGIKNLFGGLNNYNTSAKRATKTTRSLAASFGHFYANMWLFVRGVKSLWKSIESTADYIEAYNYFDVSFGKIASEWKHEYSKFGYDNAEAYAKSFTTRMNDILGKMSGVSLAFGEDGSALLTETGIANLGMNIQEMTQAASNIASITNSVGQTGEVSLAAAQSLTALAGDISSLFNIDYSSAMTNLKSGLIGQSRALYKYGIDITNATLQTYAYEHGITKAVSEMSQAEKMQLRLLAILDQSKVSWGDLANTINSPSNMIRQFKNNIAELGTVLGQLFIPILSKVLPLINGVTIALKRLISAVAGFFGISIKISDFGSGYDSDDTADYLEDTADGYNSATAAAKKYQKTILGFDQLNKLNDNESSGGGISGGGGGFDLSADIMDATNEYLAVWNDAYKQMENKAMEFADKITTALFPVRMLLADIAHGNWELAGESLSLILTNVATFISDAISSVDWYKIGKNIGEFLSGIDWYAIFSSVGDLIMDAAGAIVSLALGFLSTLPDNVVNIVEDVMELLGDNISNITDLIIEAVEFAWESVVNACKPVADWINKNVIQPVWNFFSGLADGVINFAIETVDGAKNTWNNVSNWFKTNVTDPIYNTFNNLWENVKEATQEVWDFIVGIFNGDGDIFEGFVEGVSSVFKSIANRIISGINSVISSPFNKINSLLNKIRTITVLGLQPFKGLWSNNPLPVPRIPTFATGGFPEDGLFMANHGELVGQFSNGKTAVANNKQITEGIAQAVYPAVYNAVRSAMSDTSGVGGGQMIDNRIYIGEEEVARAVTRGQQKLNRRYQVSVT